MPATKSDQELDALWRTIKLNDSQMFEESIPEANASQPQKLSRSKKCILFIERYIPGGRLILYSGLFPVVNANMDAANCWMEQLSALLPSKPTGFFADLANSRATQMLFGKKDNPAAKRPSDDKERTLTKSPLLSVKK